MKMKVIGELVKGKEDCPAKKVIFFTINDADSKTTGNHWSLLVYHQLKNNFYHYDSASGLNCPVAQEIAKKIAESLGIAEPNFIEIETPRQGNGSDCGVYAIAIAELLSKRYTEWQETTLTDETELEEMD